MKKIVQRRILYISSDAVARLQQPIRARRPSHIFLQEDDLMQSFQYRI
ncbi:hypothetical protein [Treponema endosymbiont of Eucomonympha sp.]|nr:hypothetical protein [Treponema endosymbiont of Eucomonympha sp.]